MNINLSALTVGLFYMIFSCSVFSASINIDGGFSDWDSINSLISDPMGDVDLCNGIVCRSDIIDIKVTHDDENIYILTEFGNPLGVNVEGYFLYIDSDRDSSTGYNQITNINGLGMEYAYSIAPNTASHGNFFGDARAGSWGDDFSSSHVSAVSADGSLVEIALSLSVFEILTPGFDGFSIAGGNDITNIGTYLLNDSSSTSPVPVPQVPAPPAIILMGSGLLGLFGISRRKKRQYC